MARIALLTPAAHNPYVRIWGPAYDRLTAALAGAGLEVVSMEWPKAAEADVDAVLPLLRTRLPELKVWMVGRQPSAQLQARHDGQQVFVTGKVDEVVSFYRQATVSVVPLRSGGGTRLKILEAMGLGIPVVSTSVGAEGIDLRDGVDALLADTDQAFADAVHALLTNGDRLRSISLQARALAEHRYDWRHIGRMQEAVHVQALART